MTKFIVGDKIRRSEEHQLGDFGDEVYDVTEVVPNGVGALDIQISPKPKHCPAYKGRWDSFRFDLVSGYREHSQPKKESDGKTPLDLLFRFPGLKDVADIFGSSMRKYPDIGGDFNFRKGRGDLTYKMRLVGAGLRHVFAFMQGEKLDKESGKPHIAHAICNFMMVGDLDILESFKP